jgi:hypothetical protein
LFLGALFLTYYDDSSVHSRVLIQYRFDLPELDPKSPQLDLMIDPPQELDEPIRSEPGAISRSV